MAFIKNLTDESQSEFVNTVRKLDEQGFLTVPNGKKLDKDLFEIRLIKDQNIRVFYFYAKVNIIYGVHAFEKKTQHTAKHEIKQAKKIIRKLK